MKLSANTKVGELLKAYPFLLDFLTDYTPKFQMLKNPVMRNTIGRVATLGKAAVMGDVDIDKLLKAIAEAIRNESGETVEIDAMVDAGEEDVGMEELRQEVLKGIIKDLYDGVPMEELKQRFADLICDVSPDEIAAMEQKLVEEGMPETEVKRLCDVHVQVFKESLDKQESPDVPQGHPVDTYRRENKEFIRIVNEIRSILDYIGTPADPGKFGEKKEQMQNAIERLNQIEKHYVRKENQLFPFLEKQGMSAPPQVMWAIHDEVRDLLKVIRKSLDDRNAEAAVSNSTALADKVADMVYKEDNILFPMSLNTLSEEDWIMCRKGEDEIGYAFVTPSGDWPADKAVLEQAETAVIETKGELPMQTGSLSVEQVNMILNILPLEITFVNEEDTVVYYSETRDRIFPRSPGVIGRKVQKCHPPDSVHVVNRILDEFREGKKDVAEFWLKMAGKFVHIRYFPVRDSEGRYRGVVEVMQDVTGIRALRKERRLLDWYGQ